MSLRERLGDAERHAAAQRGASGEGFRGGGATSVATNRTRDPLAAVRLQAQEALFERIGTRLYDSSLLPEQIHALVVTELSEVIAESELPLTDGERRALVNAVTQDVLGYGPIQEFLDDPDVTEIMVNSTDAIYVERDGRLEETTKRFVSEEHVRRVIERIVGEVGRRIDESSPMVDARLPDGSRANAIIPPLAVDGPTLTIRKFSRRVLAVEDLVANKTLTPRLVSFLEASVKGKVSIIISGGTGSGKTTFLNTLSHFIPETERIVTIEDAVELQLQQRHRVRLESRAANIEGKGTVTIRDLVRNALRMRPDRIVVGEVRGAEALDMLQAMNTGHEGSLTTLHANSPRDALSRLETMVLMAGMDLPLTAVREQIASAVDLVIHVARLNDGTRRVIQVSDVDGMEGNVIQLNDLYTFDFDAGADENGKYHGTVQATGIRPSFERKLRNAGVALAADLFGTDATVDPFGRERRNGGRTNGVLR
jgi:pilus assembly protein CpaF